MHRCRVLLVEDDPRDITLVMEALGVLAFEADVIVAHDGLEAVSLLEGDDFDVIIVDLNIPVIDGFEVVRRGVPAEARERVVIFTASESAAARARARELKVGAYVVKPARFGEYLDAVRGIIARC